jgi:hypothetical protein
VSNAQTLKQSLQVGALVARKGVELGVLPS